MLSIDNASFARPRKWQRLVAKMLLSQNMPYTAMGITELDARCATRPSGEPRSSQVPRYLCVTPGPYYKAAVADPCPGALTAVPVALPLPAGQAEFDALEWIKYDGTKEGAVVKWHEKTGTHLLDWDEHSLSLLTFVPKKQETGAAGGASSEESEGGDVASSGSASSARMTCSLCPISSFSSSPLCV